jgi:hypothetical protein
MSDEIYKVPIDPGTSQGFVSHELPANTWQWCIGGNWTTTFSMPNPMPCLFHRWMMRVCLGIHTRIIKEKADE